MAGPPNKKQKRSEKREGHLPQKKYYRQRAHANPFSDHDLTYPASPSLMDWSQYYPDFVIPTTLDNKEPNPPETQEDTPKIPQLPKQVEIADIGCGYGGLLFALSPKLPSTLILGLEIRSAVTEYVHEKIQALRAQSQSQTPPTTNASPSASRKKPSDYSNISILRTNSMKFLPNLFPRASLRKIFLCFPDPHFKARKHKARIVSPGLASEYAYVLQPGEGKMYTITDVEALHEWMTGHFDGHPSFERVAEEGVEDDECVAVMRTETEEGKKVERNGGEKYVGVWRRVMEPPWPMEGSGR